MNKTLSSLDNNRWPLTAGSAKNDIPKSAQNDAISLPGQVFGTVSP